MQSAASRASSFVAGMTEAVFPADVRTQMAVGMAFVIIAGHTRSIRATSPEFFDGHPDIAWSAIEALHDRIVHGDIEAGILWRFTQADLPDLLSALTSVCNWHAQGE